MEQIFCWSVERIDTEKTGIYNLILKKHEKE